MDGKLELFEAEDCKEEEDDDEDANCERNEESIPGDEINAASPTAARKLEEARKGFAENEGLFTNCDFWVAGEGGYMKVNAFAWVGDENDNGEGNGADDDDDNEDEERCEFKTTGAEAKMAENGRGVVEG